MADIIELQNVSFTYGNRTIPTVVDVSFTVRQGEFVLITGATGCGKSTLIKMLNGLIPHESGGRLEGKIIVGGENTRTVQVSELSRLVGMVFQNPDDQIFSTTVQDEVAFVLENMGTAPASIDLKVRKALSAVGLNGKERTSVHAMSGGQKQRLAVASVLAAQPKILVLDEPISQLDPRGADELLAILVKLNRSFGVTVVMVEHRLHEVAPLCERIIVMDQGKVAWDGSINKAFLETEVFLRHGLRLPQPVDICYRLGISPPAVSSTDTVAAIRRKFPEVGQTACCPANKIVTVPMQHEGISSKEVINIKNLNFRYEKNGIQVLAGINLSVGQGEIVALMGTNGAGKSTLLQHICGILKGDAGQVLVKGTAAGIHTDYVGMVMQNPDLMLFNTSVYDEIAFGLRQQKTVAQQVVTQQVGLIIQQLRLQGLEKDFPLALSRGQRLRVAIAAVLAGRPAVLLLDEPTTGQDIGHIEDIVRLVQEFAAAGGTVLFCTHDAEIAARLATRIVVMAHGQMMADGLPALVFSQQDVVRAAGLKTPPALLISQALHGEALLNVEEVVDFVRQATVGSNAG
ncbi:MAG TPA: energy-coupling factor transporter ATPase [Negativicutes bacterium]